MATVLGCGRDPGPAGVTSTSSSSPEPGILPRGDDAIDVVMGDKHACRLLRSGRVECWGDNQAGQLGDGSHVDRPTPGAVRGIEDAVAIAAGSTGTCAARRDGSVWCWGRHPVWNAPFSSDRTLPAPIDGRARVVELALTDGSLLTVDAERHVRGPGGPAGPKKPAKAIATGSGHACMITAEGQARCWAVEPGAGWTESGSKVESLRDREVISVSASTNDRGCAVTASGEVVCFGWPDGTARGPEVGIAAATSVSTGEDLTCAVAKGGLVACFEDDTKLRWIEGIDDAVKVAVGGLAACAVRRTGDVACWGDGPTGVLGNGSTSLYRTPVEVRGLPPIAQIASTSLEHFALADDGRLFHWGTPAPRGYRERSKGARGPEQERIDPVARIVGSRGEACALLKSGALVCKHSTPWGHDAEGLSGDVVGPWEPVGIPDVVALAGVWPTFAKIDGEAHHSDDYWAAVQGSGKVSVWISTGAERTSPRALRGVRDAKSVGVSGDRACVTLGSGKAICWHHKFVPLNATEGAPDLVVPLVTVPGLRDAVSAEGSCFVRKTGETPCFGMGLSGARMVPFELNEERPWLRPAWGALCVFYPSQVQLACRGEILDFKDTAPADAVAATFSQKATCVLRKDRKVACWGDNQDGEVGQAASWATDPATPVARTP